MSNVPRWSDMTPEERARRHDQAEELGKLTGITDDTCYGRCEQYRDWFIHECRGVMDPGEAHDVLDMLLNRLAADRGPSTPQEIANRVTEELARDGVMIAGSVVFSALARAGVPKAKP